MKKLIAISVLTSAAFAADFSQMSIEEMISMRGSVPVADRPAANLDLGQFDSDPDG